MARPDKVRVEFRGTVAAATDIDGVFGAGAGSEDLALVKRDANGQLILANQGEAEGIIWTPEGKADTGVANYLRAHAGSRVTVYSHAEFVDIEGDALLTEGAALWSTASGDVVAAAPGTGTAQKVGFVLEGGDTNKPRLVVNISLAD